MPGHKIWTNLPADKTYRLAKRAAEDLGFSVWSRGDGVFAAGKGNLAVSILVGAFVAYCNFMIWVDEVGDETEIRLDRNTPWWTGLIGVNRVKNKAKELANAIADEIEDGGGRVLQEKVF